MLKINNSFILFLFLFFMLSCSNSILANEQDSAIVNFFKERILDVDKSGDFNYSDGNNISLSEIEVSLNKVWELWKIANSTLEKLPTKFADKPKVLADFPKHSWNLIGEDPMPFYYIKKSIKPEDGYPLFLNLHGSGPKAYEWLGTLKLSLGYKDGPSAYIIPQIPNEKRYRWWYKQHQYAWENLIRMVMIDDTFNPNKFYMMGISEGGYGSQRLGAFYADYLAGAGPMAGGEPLHNAPPLNFRHIAYSQQTGEKDFMFGRNKETLRAKNQFDSLSKQYPGDFEHNIVIQQGRGHHIDYEPTTPWLINYSRTPRPTSFEWILFAMDGRYRRGFYNIALSKPLGISEHDDFNRASFRFNVDKNSNAIYLDAALKNTDLSKFEPIKSGSIDIYLSEDMVDFTKKVKVYYQGKRIFKKKIELSENSLIESCAIFNDPERLFPAKISINL